MAKAEITAKKIPKPKQRTYETKHVKKNTKHTPHQNKKKPKPTHKSPTIKQKVSKEQATGQRMFIWLWKILSKLNCTFQTIFFSFTLNPPKQKT